MKKLTYALVSATAFMSACDRLPFTEEGKARSAIVSSLIDPSSARYRPRFNTSKAICGIVDGKNRMGAYTGGSAFIYNKGTGSTMLYTEAPDFNDYSLWSDQSGSAKSETYSKMEIGCGFPANWRKSCDESSAAALPTNEEFCSLWRKGDFTSLYRHTHPYTY